MGLRPRHFTPPSPSLLSTTSLPDALSLATVALSPWLQTDKPKPLPRELRTVANTLARLRSSISAASQSGSPLFDRVASSDAKAALIEIRDIAARARAASAVRPRIKLDWRHRDKRTHLFYTPSGTVLTSVSSASSSNNNNPANRSIPDLPFPLEERKRIEAVANRLDTLVQVALWKGRHGLPGKDSDSISTNSGTPISHSPTPGRLAHRKGHTSLRPRLGRQGRMFSNGDMPEKTASKRAPSNSPVPSSPNTELSKSSSPRKAAWHFSLIESPITPLRSRSLESVEDGQTVLAMWRGQRVSVRIIRNDEQRFKVEADYLHSLGFCPNIPSLLGAHWEHVPMKKKNKQENTSHGYIVMEVTNGISLDKLVRQAKISDTVTKIRLLERVVAALVFAQKLNPLITHQDLHPGNILLVPSQPSLSSPDSSSPCSDPAPIFATGEGSSLTRKPTFVRNVTSSTSITATDASIQKTESQSTLPDASTTAEAGFATRVSDFLPLSKTPSGLDIGYEFPDQRSLPTSPTIGVANTSTSTIATSVSPPARSNSQASSLLDDDLREYGMFSMNSSNMAAFTLKVMDFPSANECEGVRQNASWETNSAWAGYCPPEKVTKIMRQKLLAQKEKENKLAWKQARNSKGRIRSNLEKDVLKVREKHESDSDLTSVEESGGTDQMDVDRDNDVYIMPTTRSNSSSHRQARDSETYALFGDDTLERSPVLDIDENREEPKEPEILIEPREKNVDVNQVRNQRSDVRVGRVKTHMIDRDRRPSWRASGDLRRSDRLSNLEGKELEKRKGSQTKRRIDVWSIGWLLYYTCTGHHPPRDAWARKNRITERELRDVPQECRDVITMCVEPNPSRRANLRDVKRIIDSKLQRLMFVKGVSLLESDREEAFVLLDKAVGIQSWVDGSAEPPKQSENHWHNQRKSQKEEGIGLNEKTRTALACLPLVVVRRVEWEAAGRYLKLSDLDMQQIRRALVKGKWCKADVRDGASAVRYLEAHAKDGVSSAQSALGWLNRWGASEVKKDITKAMHLWQQAVESGSDAESCNGLGLLYHHGRDNIAVDGKKGRKYYEIAVDQGYTAAAVNLGVMLHDGAGEVEADGVMARRLYELACRDGDAIAANNLGLLLQHGGVGVKPDAASARAAYEAAILRNERHHACRNLGELLWDGGEGVERERHAALDYFAMAINRGDSSSRSVAISRLKRLVSLAEHDAHQNDNVEDMQVFEKAQRLLQEVEALHSESRAMITMTGTT